MKHLDYKQSQKEITVFNSMITANILKQDNQQPINEAILSGFKQLYLDGSIIVADMV